MRIVASRGDHSVTIEVDGDSPKLLREAEAAALRLLGDPPPAKPKQPFGFAAPEGRQ